MKKMIQGLFATQDNMIISILCIFGFCICFSIICIICITRKREAAERRRSEMQIRQSRQAAADLEARNRQIVKKFDFEKEKARIIGELLARVKREAFSEDRRKSVVSKNGAKMKNSARVFDDSCSICMENFRQGEDVLITPCKHCFHVQCLQNWMNKSVVKSLNLQIKTIEKKGEADLGEVGADCPNCNLSLMLAPIVEE